MKRVPRRPWHVHQAWIDPGTLFTRQEIAEKVGVSDDVLSFWAKRGLLVAAEGGEGKGSHRRYTFAQVNIAALYKVFRDHFGANITTLTSLSDIFQRAVKTFERSPIIASDWNVAASIAQDLHDFRNGSPILVRAHDYDDLNYDELDVAEQLRKRPARTETEILAGHSLNSDHTPVSDILKYVDSLGPGHERDARIASVILGCVLTPAHLGDVSWLMRQTENGWEIREGSDEYNFNDVYNIREFGPALFIPVGSMFRKIWEIPHYSVVHRVTEGKEIAARLADFGVSATLTPDNDGGFDITIRYGNRQRAEEILNRHGYTMPEDTKAVAK